MESEKLVISIGECFQKFDQSFNRVKYFSCIADNFDISMLPDNWSIKSQDSSIMTYTMQALGGEAHKQHLVDGFRYFVQRYLVRDCIESFALCLDDLFYSLLLNGKKVFAGKTLLDSLSEAELKLLDEFKEAGLFGKLSKLESQYDLALPKDHKRVITSLKDVRNCFAHSNGVVRPNDGSKDGRDKRKFCWMTFSVFGVDTENNKQCEIELNKKYENSINVCVQLKTHYKSFKNGDPLCFSSFETYEIAMSLHSVCATYIQIMAKNELLWQRRKLLSILKHPNKNVIP